MLLKSRENRLRRKAERLGLALRKSRARRPHWNDLGAYALVDVRTNFVVAGARWELNLDQIEKILDEKENELVGEAIK